MVATQTENMKRIAKNTLLLYIRMLFGMLVSLYTSRVILNTLGVEDYGIYNVVGGVVAMFSIISNSLSVAVSRFLTFELGTGNKNKLQRIFSTSLIIHIALAFIVLVATESIGVWFLNTQMNIPADRMHAANWVLQCSILSFMFNLVSVPYHALIVAHEKMKVFAYIGILDVLLRLAVVLSLAYMACWSDQLIAYSLMLVCVSVFLQTVYLIYCRKNFEECRFQRKIDKALLKEMTGFAGWNFIGASSSILKEQGVNIVLNLFGGPSLNAARGIASQVNSAISGFVGNFMTALNPQITKLYASGEYGHMTSLIYRGARFSFYMLLFLSLPVILNTHYVLMLWLTIVPEHVVLFVRLVLIAAMCESISNPLITAMLATGNIRNYQIIVGGLQMMNLPVSYILLRMGFFPEVVLVVAIVISLCCLCARLILLRGMINLSARSYLSHVLGNILVVSLLSLAFPLIVSGYLTDNFIGFLLSCLVSMVSTGLVIYYIGCTRGERLFINEKIAGIKYRIIGNGKTGE